MRPTSIITSSLAHGVDDVGRIRGDIDHFKTVNDTYGHKAGDAVLRGVADILSRHLRRTDILCRVGGEEFVALCRRAGVHKAVAIAEQLRSTIAEHRFKIGSESIGVTASFGVATMPDAFSTTRVEEFFRSADVALYYSKQHGRVRVTHFSLVSDDAQRSLNALT